MVNVNFRKILWDGIPQGCGRQLLFRISQQNASIFITFYSIKQFELTTVALVNNCATFVILVMGWLVLSEKVSLFSFGTLCASFMGTAVVLFGEKTYGAVGEVSAASTGSSSMLNLLLLVSNPLIIGAGVIAMR